MRDKVRAARPEWFRTLETLRRSLHLTQSELGKKLETSAMTVSRWERAHADPNAYIRLGKLAGDPLRWFFWGRAGVSTVDVLRVLPAARRRLSAARIASVQVVHAGTRRSATLSLPNLESPPARGGAEWQQEFGKWIRSRISNPAPIHGVRRHSGPRAA